MNFYDNSIEDVLKNLDTNSNGLTQEEAQIRLEKNGKNKLEQAKKETLLKKFIKSFMDPMIIILLSAAFIQAVVAFIEKSGDFTDVLIILAVVTINTVLGVVQESKSENAIDALMEMTALTTKVLRDGKIVAVKSEDLVCGDVIVLEAGDSVPADCRIIESHSMKVEEAALTGESVPVNKMCDIITLKENSLSIPLGDRTNMLYSGSTVVYGRGKAVVCATAMKTEMGKIADVLNQTKQEETPLQRKMSELSKVLTKVVLAVCVLVFFVDIIETLILTHTISFDVAMNVFILAVGLAVAAIPEGLPAVVTIVLSIGVTSMSKRQALIRKLSAVETLGCTQIICSDKTGTLTQNKMTVVDTYAHDTKLLAKAMSLCSDAKMSDTDKEAMGEPTECGLVNFAHKEQVYNEKLLIDCPRIGEAPFDSNRKMMSTVHNENGKIIQYTKGANEILLTLSTHYIDFESGERKILTEEIKKHILEKSKSYADRALRVLGACFKIYDNMPENFEPENLENNLTFIGFTGMIDPCRPEVYQAIKECRKAGIRPVMITGDHIDTAVAIGKDLEIITNETEACLGSTLDTLTDEEVKELVKNISVFARVQPEHKTRIVTAFKELGYITAMTGDGVNDAPSIKTADIGIGMGITGTDVTKGVADMVLADDNFATIVNAVGEGRKIYDNIRKVLQFQLSANLAEVLIVFLSGLFNFSIFSAKHLLWINVVTDCAPGLALGMEFAEKDVMERKPRSPNESIFGNGVGVDMIIQSIFMAVIVFASYFIGKTIDTAANGVTMAFVTMNLIEIFHSFAMRSQRNSIFTLKKMNWWLVGALLIAFALTLGVVYIPFLANLFNLTHINFVELLISLGLAFFILPVVEINKLIRKKLKK